MSPQCGGKHCAAASVCQQVDADRDAHHTINAWRRGYDDYADDAASVHRGYYRHVAGAMTAARTKARVRNLRAPVFSALRFAARSYPCGTGRL